MFKTVALATAAIMMASTVSAQPAAAPTDPQIAHIAYTAGVIDIAAARQALAKSRNAKVRAFAAEMVRDHAAVNKQALALVKKLHVTPAPNPTSASLTQTAAAERAALAKLTGAAFDRAYAANEVAYHQSVNSALSGTLIPDAQNAQLKALLSTGLTLFTEHQHHAEHLVMELK